MENRGNSKATLVGSAGSQPGAWGRPRCSASKRGSSPPALLRDPLLGLRGIESTAALHLCIYTGMVPKPPGGF